MSLAPPQGLRSRLKIGVPRYTKPASATKRLLGPLYRGALRPLLARAPAVKSRLLRLAANSGAINAPREKRRIRPDEVLREVEASLRCLRRTSIDLYLIHEPDGIEMNDELRAIFLRLKADGVIKAFGLGFGGAPDESLAFGTVMQCRFPGNIPATAGGGTIHIYHGAVRYGLHDAVECGSAGSAGNFLARALERHPASSIVFSASSRHQIQQISNACRGLV